MFFHKDILSDWRTDYCWHQEYKIQRHLYRKYFVMMNIRNKNVEINYTSGFKATFKYKWSVSDYPTQAICWVIIIFLKCILHRVLPEEKELGSEPVPIPTLSCRIYLKKWGQRFLPCTLREHNHTFLGEMKFLERYHLPKIITEWRSPICKSKQKRL